MCVAIPAKIISKEDLLATVEVYGARRQVNLMLLPEEAETGDYVLVHAGFAIHKIDEATALETIQFLKEAAALVEGGESNT